MKAVGKGLAKRKKRTAQKRASAHTRQWRLAVLERDGHRCTALVSTVYYTPRLYDFALGRDEAHQPWLCRCVNDATDVHHRSNARMGSELLRDGAALCRGHHSYIESNIRPWNAASPGRRGGGQR